jgi:hypothetical protein
MRRVILLGLIAIISVVNIFAQDAKPSGRPLTMAEYDKAKAFAVADLDKDTYVKFENTYILDRYEARKPYFITGDDGMKKRMDLYKLVAKEGMQELGLMVFYTNEKGKVYKALMPNFTADGKVWEKYFEDIHAIDKVEANFVLKLSYVLSKEMGYQLYKAMNQGKDLSKDAGTYGSDICFPGSDEVAMADGSKKLLKDIKQGDEVLTFDATTKQSVAVRVKGLTTHDAKNYAITTLLLVKSVESVTNAGTVVTLTSKALQATPNHPIQTTTSIKEAGKIAIGEQLYCLNETSKTNELYTVWQTTEQAGGTQKVYNIVAESGTTFIMNNVVVRQKL